MAAGTQLGCRLLVTLIDQYAATEPSPVWAVIPIDDFDLSKGFRDITYRDFANAINIAATWLQDHLPTPEKDFETVAYAGPKDVRYQVIAVAAAKIGRKLLLPSPFASTSAQAHLIQASECRIFLHGAPFTAVVRQVISKAKGATTQALQIPELSQLLWQDIRAPFPYKRTWNEAKDDPWLIFHTSGTTGLPKLVTYSHQMMSSLDAAELMPDAHEETMNRHFEHRRWYTPLPSLHFVGMTVTLQFPIFLGAVVIIGPATSGPTEPALAKEVLKFSKAQGAMLPPALIDGLCDDVEGLECLRRLEYLYFAGAPLAPRSAEKLIGHVSLKPAMGSTEAGAYFIRITGQEDWNYYSFRPAMGLELRHISDDMYEAVFIRNPEVERWQQVFQVYPELDEFHTKDLFAKHPTKPNFWNFIGRMDDMIPFSHGEDLYVADMEAEITAAHPGISAVQIGGQGRPRPFLLVEWKDAVGLDEKHKHEVLLPIIDHANRRCSDLVKLTSELVLFTSPEKGLVRTVKGSVSRRESEELYKEEIERLYQQAK